MRFLVILIFSSFLFQIHAQSNKKNIVRTNFNFALTTNDLVDVQIDDYGNVISDKTLYFQYSLLLGSQLKSNFYYGLGIINEYMSYEMNPDVEPTEPPSSTGYSGYSSGYDHTIVKSNGYGPALFIQYLTNVSERFHLATSMIINYKFYKETIDINHVSAHYPSSLDAIGGFYGYTPTSLYDTPAEINDYNSDLKKEFFYVGFHPSIQFDIIKNFGVDLTFGTIQYMQKIKDSRMEGYKIDKKTQELNINFAPKNWLLGFYYTF